MGKVPCIEVDKGYLNEITAILESFSPHIMEEVSMAGFFTYYFFASARPIARPIWGGDIVAEVDGLDDYLRLNAVLNEAVVKLMV